MNVYKLFIYIYTNYYLLLFTMNMLILTNYEKYCISAKRIGDFTGSCPPRMGNWKKGFNVLSNT